MLESQKYLGMNDIQMDTLPKTGYIAMVGDMPIAAGFLRRVEPHFAQIDTLVTNAYAGSILRNKGIELIVDELISDANRLNLKGILALTANEGILLRAEKLGFHIVPQTVIAKVLNG